MTLLKVHKVRRVREDCAASSPLGKSLFDFYRQLAADFPLGMGILWLRDPEDEETWKVVGVNALAAGQIGTTVQDFLTIPGLMKRKDSLQQSIQAAYRQVIRLKFTLLLGHLGGTRFGSDDRHFELIAFPLAGNCVCLLLQDMTTSWRSQMGFLRAHTQMHQMTKSLGAVLWRANPLTLEFHHVSEQAVEVFGYPPERWCQEADFWRTHTEPEDWETVVTRCAKVARDGKPRQFECRMYTAKGERRHIRVLVRVLDLAGVPRILIGVMTDITEEKRIEGAARRFSSQLLRMQDQERKKISRELHDSVGQYLAGLKFNLGILESANGMPDQGLQQVVADSMSLVRTCMEQVRDVSSCLYPPMLEELGLASAIRWHASDFARRTGMKFELKIPADLGTLAPAVQLALFRIVQESLTNVYKHAQTDSAAVRLMRDQKRIYLRVEDHGVGIPPETVRGFDSASSTNGVGLHGMKERVRELGGEFTLSSNGKGTTVRVSIPLKAPHAKDLQFESENGKGDPNPELRPRSV